MFDHNHESVVAIFDVDRTLFSSTAWFHACTHPGLLIDPIEIKTFLELNRQAYEAKSLPLAKFRQQTLELVDTTISSEFIDVVTDYSVLIDSSVPSPDLKLGLAGVFTAEKLQAYSEPFELIKLLKRFYGSKFRVVFLSSGYEVFIRGVVKTLMSQHGVSCNYQVEGSELESDRNGRLVETRFLSQQDKYEYVKNLQSQGDYVCFLADDSNEEPLLFDAVERGGGKALKIDHVSGMVSNSWQSFAEDHLQREQIRTACIHALGGGAISGHVSSAERLGVKQNELGVIELPNSEFTVLLNNIEDTFREFLVEVAWSDRGTMALRGPSYYYWLPSYLSKRLESAGETWSNLLDLVVSTLSNPFELNGRRSQRIAVYALLDHFLNLVLAAVHGLDTSQLRDSTVNKQDLGELLDQAAIKTYEAIELLCSNRTGFELATLVELAKEIQSHKDELSALVNQVTFNRELDNPLEVLDLMQGIRNERVAGREPSAVASLAYGGTDLVYAYKAVVDLACTIIHIHFSSKDFLRGKMVRSELSEQFWLRKKVPPRMRHILEAVPGNGPSMLVLDNNVTTFESIRSVKTALRLLGWNVRAAVDSFYIDNMVDYLVGNDAEELIEDWYAQLDYSVSKEYVSAFSTWGTGQKAALLEKAYYRPEAAFSTSEVQSKQLDKYLLVPLKLCRVHNLVDLEVAKAIGACQIGIHAVYSDQLKYLEQHSSYKPIYPINRVVEGLPISWYELQSIQEMVSQLKGIAPVVLFEERTPLPKMLECLKIFGITEAERVLQFQHRVDSAFIEMVKKTGVKVIATVGFQQQDFRSYFQMLASELSVDDVILIDFSQYQPDLISGAQVGLPITNKEAFLNEVAPLLALSDVPIMVADHASRKAMTRLREILVDHSVNFAGFDIQNVVEAPRSEQRYVLIDGKDGPHQGLVRKSSSRGILEWGS